MKIPTNDLKRFMLDLLRKDFPSNYRDSDVAIESYRREMESRFDLKEEQNDMIAEVVEDWFTKEE